MPLQQGPYGIPIALHGCVSQPCLSAGRVHRIRDDGEE
jgi:hypothetical protein